jgi:dethiobiotin synthetase
MIVLVTATGTDAGKTTLTRGLARAVRRRGIDVVALKPFETGVETVPVDAVALEQASGARWEGPWYRAKAPVAPWSATLMGEPPPDWDTIVAALRAAADHHAWCLVEGAGGPRVPIDATREVRDLASELGAAVVLVAPDVLGVLSYTFTAVESLTALGNTPIVVLRDVARPDPSATTNAMVLERKLGRAPFRLPFVVGDDDALADAVERSGLVEALGQPPARP